MIWTDIADWIGPTVNKTSNAMGNVAGVVLHIQEGTEAGTESWQRNPASQVSSHFLAPKRGRLRQMVDTADKAWCQAAGNAHWLSIENEGYHGQLLTADQLESCSQVLAKAHQLYGVPMVATNDPYGSGLGWHGMGGAAWGGHYDCPGTPIVGQRPAIINRATEIVNGDDMDPKLAFNLERYLWALFTGQDAKDIYDPAGNRVTVANNVAKRLTDLEAKVNAPAGVKVGDKVSLTVDSVSSG